LPGNWHVQNVALTLPGGIIIHQETLITNTHTQNSYLIDTYGGIVNLSLMDQVGSDPKHPQWVPAIGEGNNDPAFLFMIPGSDFELSPQAGGTVNGQGCLAPEPGGSLPQGMTDPNETVAMVGSFDPNNITANPAGVAGQGWIDAGQPLTY